MSLQCLYTSARKSIYNNAKQTCGRLMCFCSPGRALEDVRLCVLGARSEAILPLPYWRELLVAAPPHVRRIELVMVRLTFHSIARMQAPRGHLAFVPD